MTNLDSFTLRGIVFCGPFSGPILNKKLLTPSRSCLFLYIFGLAMSSLWVLVWLGILVLQNFKLIFEQWISV